MSFKDPKLYWINWVKQKEISSSQLRDSPYNYEPLMHLYAKCLLSVLVYKSVTVDFEKVTTSNITKDFCY